MIAAALNMAKKNFFSSQTKIKKNDFGELPKEAKAVLDYSPNFVHPTKYKAFVNGEIAGMLINHPHNYDATRFLKGQKSDSFPFGVLSHSNEGNFIYRLDLPKEDIDLLELANEKDLFGMEYSGTYQNINLYFDTEILLGRLSGIRKEDALCYAFEHAMGILIDAKEEGYLDNHELSKQLALFDKQLGTRKDEIAAHIGMSEGAFSVSQIHDWFLDYDYNTTQYYSRTTACFEFEPLACISYASQNNSCFRTITATVGEEIVCMNDNLNLEHLALIVISTMIIGSVSLAWWPMPSRH